MLTCCDIFVFTFFKLILLLVIVLFVSCYNLLNSRMPIPLLINLYFINKVLKVAGPSLITFSNKGEKS